MALPDSSTASGKADWKRILQKTLPNVDIFLPGIEEIIYMLHRDIYEKENLANKWPSFLLNLRPDFLHNMSQEILDMGVKIVGFKLGERGFYLKTAEKTKIVLSTKDFPIDPGLWANRELWAPCFKVDVVGTAGSGDATIAGFLTGLLRGMSIEEAAILAVAVGACSVEKADTISGIRSFEDTVKRIYSRWEMHELAINSPGWHYNEKDNLWIFE